MANEEWRGVGVDPFFGLLLPSFYAKRPVHVKRVSIMQYTAFLDVSVPKHLKLSADLFFSSVSDTDRCMDAQGPCNRCKKSA